MRYTILLTLALAALTGCQNEPAGQTSTAATPANTCILAKDGVENVKIGQPVPPDMPYMNTVTGEGTFKIYQVKRASGTVMAKVYPIEDEAAHRDKVHMIEYIGYECGADKGVKVGSTLGDILAAWPDAKVHGSEIEGRTTATAGGWNFLLNCHYWEAEIDPAALDKNIKILAIVLM